MELWKLFGIIFDKISGFQICDTVYGIIIIIDDFWKQIYSLYDDDSKTASSQFF